MSHVRLHPAGATGFRAAHTHIDRRVAAAAPPVLLAHTASGSTNGTTFTTAAINTAGATLLVAAVSGYNGVDSFSDSKSNTWTALTVHNSAASGRVQFCYATTSLALGAGHTFTATGANFPAIAVAAYSGTLAGTGADFDVGGGAASAQPGSATPSANNELVFTALADNNVGPYSVNQGFTIIDQVAPVTNQCVGVALAVLFQTAAAALDPTWSNVGANTFSSAMTAFKTR